MIQRLFVDARYIMLRKLFSNESFLLAFLAFNVYIIWLVIYYPYFDNPTIWFTQITVEVLLIYLSVLYTNFYLVPRYLYQQRYFAFVFGLLLFMAIQSIAIMLTYHLVAEKSGSFWETFSRSWMERIFVTRILWVIVAIAVRVYIDQIKLNKKLTDTLREKTQSDLDFLKSQIAPHFLFNGLNTIFFKIAKENAAARETLMIFSSLLRYQLYESQRVKVLLAHEINYLSGFIDFYRIRMGDRIEIQFNYPDLSRPIEVHPLLFSPLIENAFKYVSQYESKPNLVQVELQVAGNEVIYQVMNTTTRIHSEDEGSGIGLHNLQKRLQLVYPDRHDLQLSLQDNIFKAVLKLKID